MSHTELLIDEHRKAVLIFEEEKVIIILDMYPCDVDFSELKSGNSVELDRVKVVFQDIRVSEPFLMGKVEFLCIIPEERCASISAILAIPYNFYKQKGLEEVLKEIRKFLQQYEKCISVQA
jgi:hypothetical protein